jgi:hypothetical protein
MPLASSIEGYTKTHNRPGPSSSSSVSYTYSTPTFIRSASTAPSATTTGAFASHTACANAKVKRDSSGIVARVAGQIHSLVVRDPKKGKSGKTSHPSHTEEEQPQQQNQDSNSGCSSSAASKTVEGISFVLLAVALVFVAAF